MENIARRKMRVGSPHLIEGRGDELHGRVIVHVLAEQLDLELGALLRCKIRSAGVAQVSAPRLPGLRPFTVRVTRKRRRPAVVMLGEL